jgi:cytochrome bd ubiquinol oxidase subunit II
MVGSLMPALLLGVAFVNIFQGIPIDSEGIYQGDFFGLLNFYGLLGGILFIILFLVHGTLWLIIKSTGDLQKRAIAVVTKFWLLLLAVAVIFLFTTWFKTHLYENYLNTWQLFIIPLIAVASLLMNRWFIGKAKWWSAWFASSATIVSVTLFGIVGLYPNLLPSSLDEKYSITIFNSASSQLTLKIMLAVALIFVPIVLVYQFLVYRFFSGKVADSNLTHEENY